jgi:hypothetical protein
MGAKNIGSKNILRRFSEIRKTYLIKVIRFSKVAMYLWSKLPFMRFLYPLKYIDRVRLAAILTKECKFLQAKHLLETIKQKNFFAKNYPISEKLRFISGLNGCDAVFDANLFDGINIKEKKKPLFKYTLGLFPFKSVDHEGDFLFVSGAPRSGTTALGRMLNLSKDIALQMERFNHNGGYHPALFNVSEVKGLGWDNYRYKEYAVKAFAKLPNAQYTGDKRPNFLFSWNITKRNFTPKNIKIIHIIRDIEDIACSYNKRSQNEKDKWHDARNYKAAVYETNRNNRLALELLTDPIWKDSISVVTYKKFFANPSVVFSMFKWLNIKIDKKLDAAIIDFLKKSTDIVEKDRTLPMAHKRYLKRHFDFDTYQQLEEISL